MVAATTDAPSPTEDPVIEVGEGFTDVALGA
jgi:hypothetical protein